MGVGELLGLALLIIFAAAVGEAVIEFLVVPVVNLFWANNEEHKKKRTVLLNSLSGGLGVGIAFIFRLAIFTLLGGIATDIRYDYALTGILLGRGSNFVHSLLLKYYAGTMRAKLDAQTSAAWLEQQEKIE